MSTKRVRTTAAIIVILLGLGTIAIGLREFLIPGLMTDYVDQMRHDYGLVKKLGLLMFAWGLLLFIFCWHLRIRNLWFVVAVGVMLYGLLYVLVPDQSLEMLKRIYLEKGPYLLVSATAKVLIGAGLLASVKFTE
jgi:hypothetical protein